MRRLSLSDIDLGARRITVGDVIRPLDSVTYYAVVDYLRHRRERWPVSANPHFLVSQQTTYEDGPVSATWVKQRFKGLTATLDQLRVDRQVDELLAHGPDPLHFMAIFGVSPQTAMRYAKSVAAMLTTSLEDAHSNRTTDEL